MPGEQRADDEPVPAKVITTMLTRSHHVYTLLGLYKQHGATFNQVHISAFWTTLGKHARREARQRIALEKQLRFNATLFATARTQTVTMLPKIGGRELVNVAHGAPRLRLPRARVCTRCTRTHVVRACACDGARVCGHDALAHACVCALARGTGIASAGLSSQGEWVVVWSALERECTQRMGVALAQPDHVARPGQAQPGSAHPVKAQLGNMGLAQFSEQGLVNMVWAFATAGHDAPDLYRDATGRIYERLEMLTPQGIANTLWVGRGSHSVPALPPHPVRRPHWPRGAVYVCV